MHFAFSKFTREGEDTEALVAEMRQAGRVTTIPFNFHPCFQKYFTAVYYFQHKKPTSL
jgi:hypothetical protein